VYWDERIETMSRDEMMALQSEKLVKLVNYVYDNSPFYHEKFNKIGLLPGDIKGLEDISKIPFTTKEELRENYPYGLLSVPREKISRVQGTSGTTGKLTVMSYTANDENLWAECVARCLTMAGVDSKDIVHICYGLGLFTGGFGLDYGCRKAGALVVPMSSGNTKRQLMVMEDLGATVLACTPSYAMHLAEMIEEQGLLDRMKLRVGIMGAEPWTEEMRQQIESKLKIECFDIYGMCEIIGPGVAMNCHEHNGLHVNHDHFLPEVVDPGSGIGVPDGELGELVFTTLDKEAMPLLRYRTKDLTSINYSTCACGRTMPRITKFKGRTDDMKVIRGVNVFPTQVETVLLGLGEGILPHYQMIVDRVNNSDVLTVMVEVDDRIFSDEIRVLDGMKKKIGAALKDALGISVVVKLVAAKSIERSEGKAKRVIDNRNLV